MNGDKGILENIGDGMKNAWQGFKNFLDQYDAEAWPPFLIFLAVVTFGMFMNFMAFKSTMGDVPALVVAIFFEAAILAWKMTSNRKRNSAVQNQLANLSTWLSVALAIGMLVVNMFRVGGETNFETISYVIVGVAALVQVVFYLLFSQADQDLRILREHSQNVRGQKRKRQEVDNVMAELSSDVDIMITITNELKRIKDESAGLPTVIRENLLDAARKKLMKQFDIKNLDEVLRLTDEHVDLNRDGKIGMSAIEEKLTRERWNRQNNHAYQPDLEEIKKHPVDELFEDEEPPIDVGLPTELPTELPTDANTDQPSIEVDDNRPF